MRRKITTISLDLESYEWAKKNMPNLSHFIRAKIQEQMSVANPQPYHLSWRSFANACYPNNKNGSFCSLCYPAGPPEPWLWMEYMSERANGYSVGQFIPWMKARLSAVAKERSQEALSNYPSNEKAGQTVPDRPKKLLRRIFSFFYN